MQGREGLLWDVKGPCDKEGKNVHRAGMFFQEKALRRRAGSQPLCKVLTKCQIFGSDPVLVLLFCLHLNGNSDFAPPGESSDYQAVPFLLLVSSFCPYESGIFVCIGRKENFKRKGKKAIHTHLNFGDTERFAPC